MTLHVGTTIWPYGGFEKRKGLSERLNPFQYQHWLINSNKGQHNIHMDQRNIHMGPLHNNSKDQNLRFSLFSSCCFFLISYSFPLISPPAIPGIRYCTNVCLCLFSDFIP